MFSKSYCTDAFSPFFSRSATLYSVCQSLKLCQARTDVGPYTFVGFIARASRQELKKEKKALRNKIFISMLWWCFFCFVLFIYLFFLILKYCLSCLKVPTEQYNN